MAFVNLGVEHFRDFMLKFSIDLYWRWWEDDTIRNGVQSYRLQHGDVEDRVDCSHSVRELECEGMRAGLCDDFKGSEELFGQLPGGLGHVEILRLNIDKVSDLELWCQSLMGVHQTLIAMLHCGDFVSEFLVELIQVYSKFSGTSQSNFVLGVH